jgi:hypothetical protein
MESQEIFNTMMDNAIVYLQEKGYIPTQPSATKNNNNNIEREYTDKEETEMLIKRGLLPRR